jgi:hypothetical protein
MLRDKNGTSKPSVEKFGERVFVTNPRMFSFSHRAPNSIRHPNIPVVIQTIEADMAKAKKVIQSRSERLSDALNEIAADDERWKIVSRMLDSKLFEADISSRRQHAIDTPSLRRALETWWCKAGGTPLRGIPEDSYKLIHASLYAELLQQELTLHSVITKGIHQDWLYDSEGRGEVPFGRFYICMLEIADNWVPSCDGEAYGNFLQKLLETTFRAAPAIPRPISQDEWSEKNLFLKRNAHTYYDPPCVAKRRTIRHTTEYVRTK